MRRVGQPYLLATGAAVAVVVGRGGTPGLPPPPHGKALTVWGWRDRGSRPAPPPLVMRREYDETGRTTARFTHNTLNIFTFTRLLSPLEISRCKYDSKWKGRNAQFREGRDAVSLCVSSQYRWLKRMRHTEQSRLRDQVKHERTAHDQAALL